MEEQGEVQPRRRRITFFGFLFGSIFGFIALVIFIQLAMGIENVLYPRFHFRTSGDDVSLHKGVIIKLDGTFTQKCNGVCDSIMYDDRGSLNTFDLRIVDAKRKCVLCDRGNIFSRGLALRWSVTGRERLELKALRPYRD